MSPDASAESEGLREVRPGRNLNVRTYDAGAPVTLFFVHGSGGNVDQWRFSWRHLSDGSVNLVGWDAMGHGRSPQPRDPCAYDGREIVADARAVFARHRTERNIVIAHSLGARYTLAWLLDDPAAADALVLLAPSSLDAGGGRRALFGKWLGSLPLPVLELLRPWLTFTFRRLAWHPGADPALVRAEERATRTNRLFIIQASFDGAPVIDLPQLARLTMPVEILTGDHDRLVPGETADRLCAVLPNATHTVVPRCGHQIMLERPAETNAAISAAIAVAPGLR